MHTDNIISTELSEDEWKTFRALRNARVLQDLEGHRLDYRNGHIMVLCGDCDRSDDIVDRHHKTVRIGKLLPQASQSSRLHKIMVNGGALTIPQSSPINDDGMPVGKFIINQIRGAQDLKKIDDVALYAHCICGAAKLANLDLLGVMELLFAAKQRVREAFPDVRIFAFMHIDKGIDKDGQKVMHTYYACRKEWEAFKEQQKNHSIVCCN